VKQLAPGLWRLKEFPAPTINIYLAEDVLIDAGRTWDRRRVFAEIEGREISMLALTHVHPDHQGVAKDVCDRVAICGDVIRNMSYATGLPEIKEPPEIFTADPAENRRSIRKLANLKPATILPGHGPAVTDIGAFERFVGGLPA